MAQHICGSNISTAWIRAINHLYHQKKLECFNLLVEIVNPNEIDEQIQSDLSSMLKSNSMQSIETVANTIFPNDLYLKSGSKDYVFDTYKRIFPKIKKSPDGNRRDTYFNRLIHWPLASKQEFNQIDEIIKKLTRELGNSNPKRVVYEALVTHPYLEASVYEPETDYAKITGFPCLSFLSFKLEEKRLNLTAVYRNHFFIERAYGNYLGLANLQNFVAKEAGCAVGSLCVLSTHAEIDQGPAKPSKTVIERLLLKYEHYLED